MSEALKSEPKLKFVKDFEKKEDKDFAKKTSSGKEYKKEGAWVGICAGAGAIKGGSLGVAVAGTAFGVPLVVAGAGVGLAGYGAYKAYQAIKKDLKKKKHKF